MLHLARFVTLVEGKTKLADMLDWRAEGLISWDSFSVFREQFAVRDWRYLICHRESQGALLARWLLCYQHDAGLALLRCCQCVSSRRLNAPMLAVQMARDIHDACDWPAMPILADVLDDAGYPDEASHCRTAIHGRGCYVLEGLI